MKESGNERFELDSARSLASCRHSTESEPMISLIAGNDLVAILSREFLPAILSRDLESCFVCLGPTVAEEGMTQIPR